MKTYENIAAYQKDVPKEAKAHFTELLRLMRKEANMAEEKIAYGIPTFVLHGNLVHIGAYKDHIGFYPTSSAVGAFKRELKPYNTAKGTVQFTFDTPLPVKLIKDIVKFRIKENMEKADALPFIGAPALRALEANKIKKLGQLSKVSKEYILSLHGVGPKAVRILEQALKRKGKAFKKEK